MKPLEFTPEQWAALYTRLSAEYGPRINITYVMRRELGCTVRRHSGTYWNANLIDYQYRVVFCLDFYDESMRTFFILKYLGEQYNEG